MAASSERPPGPASAQRVAGASGLAFVLLLLVGAGMASVPGADDTTAAIRAFYAAHTGVVVLAQAVELVATIPLVVFVLGVAKSGLVDRSRPLRLAGITLAGAALLTLVPPLWLCVVASSGSAALVDALALLSDLVDVLLFVTIAGFAVVCAREWMGTRWLRWVALGVAALCGLRAVEILLSGSILAVAGPVAFLLLVVGLSVSLLARPPAAVERRAGQPVRP